MRAIQAVRKEAMELSGERADEEFNKKMQHTNGFMHEASRSNSSEEAQEYERSGYEELANTELS